MGPDYNWCGGCGRDDLTLPPERIVAVAVSFMGMTFSVPAPGRHHDVLHAMHATGLTQGKHHLQGFITSTGRFVDRRVGKEIARLARQLDVVRPKTDPASELFSEDLW